MCHSWNVLSHRNCMHTRRSARKINILIYQPFARNTASRGTRHDSSFFFDFFPRHYSGYCLFVMYEILPSGLYLIHACYRLKSIVGLCEERTAITLCLTQIRFMWVWFMYRNSHGIDVIKITADFNLVLWPIYCLCFFGYKLAVMDIIISRFFTTYLYWISGDYISFDYC